MRVTPVLLPALLVAACAPTTPDPPVPHHGTCSHYTNALHQQEDVPNCLLRGQNTMINGLPPVNPYNKS